MKPNVSLKSLVRQPVQSLLLFLLIGLISFASLSQMTEYWLIRNKIDELGSYYHTVGTLQTINKDGNVFKGAELISKSPYVALEDRRRSCSGVLQGGLYNADADGVFSDSDEIDDYKNFKQANGIHISDVIVYATLLSKVHATPEAGNKNSLEEYFLTFQVNKVVAGYPEYVKEGKTIKLSYVPKKTGEADTAFDSLNEGKEYLIRAYYNPWRCNPLVVSWKKNAGDWLTWKPLTGSGLWVLPVEPGKAADFNAMELKELKNDLDVLQENQHAMCVWGTKDMSTMPDTQESAKQLYLEQGRWLDREDDLKANRVCVVSSSFAKLRGLSVGDSITLKLRNLRESFYEYIITLLGIDENLWRNAKTQTEIFKIVGFYGFLDSQRGELTMYTNMLYIPDSCLPTGYGDMKNDLYFPNYSFVLKSYRDRDAFLAENRSKLAAMGITVTFMDNGSANFWSSADSLKFSALLSAAVFCVVLLLAFGLAVFLYLRPRRKEFAIQRALGRPRRSAAFQMAWPFLLLGIVGIFLGGAIGWNYAFQAAAKSLAGLQTKVSAVSTPTGLPVGWMFLLCGCILALLALFTWIGTLSVSRRPVLELLRGASRAGTGKRKKHK
jgi:hypothetical protein